MRLKNRLLLFCHTTPMGIFSTALLYFSFSIALSLGSEICRGPPLESGEIKLYNCTNTYYKYAFCCGWNGDHYKACCFTTKVWALWYFWLGIFLFVALIASCVGFFLRWKKLGAKGDNDSDALSEGERQVAYVITEQVPLQQPTVEPPPPYQAATDSVEYSQANEVERYEGKSSTNSSSSSSTE